MRLLAVYPYVPYPLDRGAYHRAFQWVRALAQEHTVDFLGLAEQGESEEHKPVFEEFCGRVEIIPFQHPPWQRLIPGRLLNPLPATIAHWTVPAFSAALDRLMEENAYDAVHLCDFVLGHYLLAKKSCPPLVADRTRVDLQYQLMEGRHVKRGLRQQALNYENMLKIWRYEKRMARACRFQILCGPDDETFFLRHIRRDMDLAVIPNGVDAEYFRKESAETPAERQPAILFCGAMDYTPNVDALRWYFGEMHEALRRKIEGIQVLIVGKNPVEEVRAYAQKPGVTVTGGVPDVRPFYRRAWAQIVPLRIGGGTRLKIVESMAMETPVISTTIGAQGLPIQHGRDILLADTPDAFVKETARALSDLHLRSLLASEGHKTVHEKLAWPMLGEQLREAYRRRFRWPAANGKTSRAGPAAS